jgi:hypothetical protein
MVLVVRLLALLYYRESLLDWGAFFSSSPISASSFDLNNYIGRLAHAAAAGTHVGPWVTMYILESLLSEKRAANA